MPMHVKSLVTRALPHINILKALTGTNWGQQKETILITYNSLIRSLFMYATPIWFSNTSPSIVQKLQTIQNSALHIATGCVKMASVGHLLEETEMLPVKDHLYASGGYAEGRILNSLEFLNKGR